MEGLLKPKEYMQGFRCIIWFPMKIMTWNVRGLRRPEKMRKIKSILKEGRADVVLLQETKRSRMEEEFIKLM